MAWRSSLNAFSTEKITNHKKIPQINLREIRCPHSRLSIFKTVATPQLAEERTTNMRNEEEEQYMREQTAGGVMRRRHNENGTPHEDEPRPLTHIHPIKSSRPTIGPRRSSAMSIDQINQVLSHADLDVDTYDVSEIREGLFDACFLDPSYISSEDLLIRAENTLPQEFEKHSPLAAKHFLPRQAHELASLCRRIATTRAGIRLLKAFVAYFIAYAMCLAPVVRKGIGRYYYIMVISVILNHPARTIGAQIEGTILTITGTAIGLGWGVVALLLSTSSLSASAGYGGILSMFLALFMLVMAWIRAFFVRFYQGVLCAAIAAMFMTLSQTYSHDMLWRKVRDYAIPWLLGQAIAFIVNILVFPDGGSRAIAIALHQSLGVMQEPLDNRQRSDSFIRRQLAAMFVNLSEAYRDMRTSLTISKFRPDHIEQLRNHMQAVIRSLLSLETGSYLLEPPVPEDCYIVNVECADSQERKDSYASEILGRDKDTLRSARKSIDLLRTPTQELLSLMKEGLGRCDAALMDISGYRNHLGPPQTTSSDLGPTKEDIKAGKAAFDLAESTILSSKDLSTSALNDDKALKLLVFARHVREAVSKVEALLDHVESMQQVSDWPRIYVPSYPLWKAFHRTNAQVRHDRGGVAAGSYHKTFGDIAQVFDKIKSSEHEPMSETMERRQGQPQLDETRSATDDETTTAPTTAKKKMIRYKVWRMFYHLQGYESKYAFKVCLVISLLSIPSYLPQSTGWWDEYEVWWAVVMSWAVMHPRVGGNVQDLVTRAGVAILGVVWSGVGHAAGHGNPYVMGVFAALYMAPMLYRYTISSHPRSGLAGCLSFTILSLGLQTHGGDSSPALVAVLKGLCFFIGTVVPILVNWILWPFVARHELRVALSSMMIFMSILYRNVVAKYVYFRDGKEPTPEDIQRSEILEGRLREGFVRIRQLLVLTRHELRLRAPFDPLPYAALSDACERFFDYLITVRQSAIFYNPSYIRDDPIAAKQLLTHRRDAVAAVLGNLYILAGALRSQRKVPLYMPSAAAARKRLLLKTAQVEEQMARRAPSADVREHKIWSDIYSFSYHESLTGCVIQLEELEKYTKIILGAQGFDDEFSDDDDVDDIDDHVQTQGQ